MPDRPRGRKPWPDQARDEYYCIEATVVEIQHLLLEVHDNGLNGVRSPYLVKRRLPLVIALATNIQTACARFDTKRDRRTAYWASQAIQNIDLIAAEIAQRISRADDAFNNRMRNMPRVENEVRAAMALPAQILQELYGGPPPEPEPEAPKVFQEEAWSWSED